MHALCIAIFGEITQGKSNLKFPHTLGQSCSGGTPCPITYPAVYQKTEILACAVRMSTSAISCLAYDTDSFVFCCTRISPDDTALSPCAD